MQLRLGAAIYLRLPIVHAAACHKLRRGCEPQSAPAARNYLRLREIAWELQYIRYIRIMCIIMHGTQCSEPSKYLHKRLKSIYCIQYKGSVQQAAMERD